MLKKIFFYIMPVLYILAGINHFWHPEFYVKIMPPYLPWHEALVFISGVAEVALGILLLFRATRRLAAWGIILLLVAVFPANIQMMLDYKAEHNPKLWIAILRLPLQIPLIWWAYQFTKSNGSHQGTKKHKTL